MTPVNIDPNYVPPPAEEPWCGFATTEDVATKLARALTAAEESLACFVIGAVTGVIRDDVGKDADWARALDPVPETLRQLCVDKAIGAIVNPSGGAAVSETLGAHTVTDTFRRSDADGGPLLTDAEKRAARAAIYGGRDSASSTPGTVLDDLPFDGSWWPWPVWAPEIPAGDDEW